ncbi:MAG: roadblock/LC7 domain-containing protein [Oceanobacter sp.]
MNQLLNPVSQTLESRAYQSIQAFTDKTDGLRYMTLSSSDGYVLAHSIPPGVQVDAKRLAAMASSFTGISQSLVNETLQNGVEGSIVVCRLIQSDQQELVLLGVFDASSNHGLALWALNHAARDIASLTHADVVGN